MKTVITIEDSKVTIQVDDQAPKEIKTTRAQLDIFQTKKETGALPKVLPEDHAPIPPKTHVKPKVAKSVEERAAKFIAKEKPYVDVEGIPRRYERVCAREGCNNVFQTDMANRKCCSNACRVIYTKASHQESNKKYNAKKQDKQGSTRVCQDCGDSFYSKTGTAKYCRKCIVARQNLGRAKTRSTATYGLSSTSTEKHLDSLMAKPEGSPDPNFNDPWNCANCRGFGKLCILHLRMQDQGQKPPELKVDVRGHI